MSHITSVEVEVRDLAAVKALCKEKGWEFMEGQKTCQFWNRQKHPCDHAIKVPGAMYDAEIGLGARPDGKGFNLVFDPMCFKHDLIGEKGGRFMQGYGIAKAELEAKKRGMHVKRVPGKNGAVKLVLTGAMG